MTEPIGVDQDTADQGKVDPAEGGIVDDLTWLGRGFFQTLYSLQFYRAATQKSLIDAILFFVVFGTLLTIISTFNLSRNLSSVADDIEQAFATGEFPEIVIENGLATVRARQPLILLKGEGKIAILDTTGAYQSIDTSRYTQGFLLTRDSLHAYSDGDYQVVQLRDLNNTFGNPIVVSRDTALDFWRSFTPILSVVAFIGIGLWNLLVRFMGLTLLAVLVWGVLSAFNIRSEYGPVLTLGIYALVPAVYISFLLGSIGISFCGFQTGLLLVIWVLVARWVLKANAASEPPAQLKEAQSD
ncbi:MAG: DUF1189 family protein [Anaerolineales bacterium]